MLHPQWLGTVRKGRPQYILRHKMNSQPGQPIKTACASSFNAWTNNDGDLSSLFLVSVAAPKAKYCFFTFHNFVPCMDQAIQMISELMMCQSRLSRLLRSNYIMLSNTFCIVSIFSQKGAEQQLYIYQLSKILKHLRQTLHCICHQINFALNT